MYGWIVDGISSLFEPIAGQKLTDCSVNENVSEGRVKLQKNSGRAAKRSYHSIDTNEGVRKSEVEVKRRKLDVVLSFVKKTVARVAGVLGLRSQQTNSNLHFHYEDSQSVTPMGIDELHTSFIKNSEWVMDKPGNDRGSKNLFPSSSPPWMRRHSGACLPERRGSLQLLPSRPALRLGANNVDPACSGFGHNRCYKPSLTVEETIRQNNKEHYRRLLEMVREKYSKNQPLPFNQTRPQNELSSKTEQTVRKPFTSGQTGIPGVFTWRNPSNPSTRCRWNAVHFRNTFNGPPEDSQPERCAKQKQAVALDLSTEVATRLNLVDKAPSAISVSESCSRHSAHARYSDEDVPRLSKEMAAEVSCALALRDPNVVLSAAFKLRITPRDLATLQEGGWLNDEVINFYLSLVMERNSGKEGGLKVYVFSTFFFPKLQGLGTGQTGGHAAVKRWTKAVDLFLCDLILVPLHLGVHWALAVIDLKSKTVKSYDSMGQRHEDICNLLLHYIKEEHKVKKGRELDDTKWTICSMKPIEIPQQKNGSDCGVFACKYADYIAKDRPLTFKQCHMPLFRKLMIWEILNQKLL